MTFDEFWRRLVAKTPKIHDEDTAVKIKAIQLKRLLRQAHDMGAKDTELKNKQGETGYDFLDSLFKGR
jgi:hypothetical protein